MDNDQQVKLVSDVQKLKKALKIAMKLLYSLPGFWGDGLNDDDYEFMEQVLEEYRIHA